MGNEYIERNKTIQTGEKVPVNPRHRAPEAQGATRSTSQKARYQKVHKRGQRIGKLPRIARGSVPQLIF